MDRAIESAHNATTAEQAAGDASRAELPEHCEIWISSGEYEVPFENTTYQSVTILSNVYLVGGFAGWEDFRDERNYQDNPTVFTGKQETASASNVFTSEGTNIRLDGLTITGANGVEDSRDGGGVLWIPRQENATLKIVNCTIYGNKASNGGGAALYGASASPTLYIENTVFASNEAESRGANLFIASAGSVTAEIRDSIFIGISDPEYFATMGGAISLELSNSTFSISRCLFSENRARDFGGALLVRGSSNVVGITNSVFHSNKATEYYSQGGAVYLQGQNPMKVNHSVFFGNYSGLFGAIAQQGDESDVEITNSVFWKNTSETPSSSIPNTAIVEYSTISKADEGSLGAGVIRDDPRFSDPEAGNFHLEARSPCIDSADGNRSTQEDMGGASRIDIEEVPNTGIGPPWSDMGAYEFHEFTVTKTIQ